MNVRNVNVPELITKELNQSPYDVKMLAQKHIYELFDIDIPDSKTLSKLALDFCNKCFLEEDDYISIHGSESSYATTYQYSLHEILELFLKHGMNPNEIIENENIMREVIINVDGRHIGAYCLKLLLDYGGDPNLIVDGDSVFSEHDFDIIFGVREQENKRMYEAWFYTWIVMIGYGAKRMDGKSPVNIKDGFNIEEFRDYENFNFWIEYTDRDPEGWIMHIFRKETLEEVAFL